MSWHAWATLKSYKIKEERKKELDVQVQRIGVSWSAYGQRKKISLMTKLTEII